MIGNEENKLDHGRIKGLDLREKLFKVGIEINELNIIMGNINFRIFEMLANSGYSLEKLEKINIIISGGRNKVLFDLFRNFQLHKNEEKREILLKEIFYSLSEVDSNILNLLKYFFNINKLEIKLGFTESESVYVCDEILFDNKYSIIGNFDETEIFDEEEYYYVIKKKEAVRSHKLFMQKFNNSYPFERNSKSKSDNEYLTSLSERDTDNFFDLREFILGVLNSSDVKVSNQEEVIATASSQEVVIVKEEVIISDEEIHQDENPIEDAETEKIRPYQKEAIDSLLLNKFNGKLQMATGTGKTYTTLYGLKEYLKINEEIKNITLVVPLKLLVEQWEKEIANVFGNGDLFAEPNYKITKCYSDEDEWQEQLEHYVGKTNKEKYNFIIFVDNSFKKYISDEKNIDNLKEINSILIADEAHNLPEEVLRNIVKDDIFHSKLALSATLYDDDKRKNELIDKVFNGTDFSYDIKDAISSGYLCKYKYFPQIVDLESLEIQEYKRIKNKINVLEARKEYGGNYLELKKEEANLLSKAHRKVGRFEMDIAEIDDIDSILVYSNPGNYGEEKYIDYVSNLIEKKIDGKVEKIVGETNAKNRETIIQKFKEKEIKAITAIRCLDEGVDIPTIKRAFLLYSGGKEKEYIQRRGRILRISDNKDIAYIHDYIVRVDNEFPLREIKRFNEYSSVAINKDELKNFLRGDNIEE